MSVVASNSYWNVVRSRPKVKPPGTPIPMLSLKLTVGLSLLLVGMAVHPVVITIVLWLNCIRSLFGIRQAMQGFALAAFIKYLNPAIYHFPGEVGIVAWLTLILGGFRILAKTGFRRFHDLLPLLAFVAVAMVLSVAQDNESQAVSAIKLIVFAYVTSAVIAGVLALNQEDISRMTVWMFSLMAAIVLLSVCTFPFPAIAYALNGTGFQGILNHPQSFGPLLAPLACWSIASAIFSGRSVVKGLSIGGGLIGLMFLSEARTAIVASLLSLTVTLFVVIFRQKAFSGFRFGRAITIIIGAVVAFATTVLLSAGVREKLLGFIFKHNSKTVEAALATRAGGIASQWENFLNSPLIGYGFGVYPGGRFRAEVTEFWGIPISAPVEKGFLPTAVLEETGIIGAVALIFLLGYMTRLAMKYRDAAWIALFFACITVNVGEMVFFSVGGIGLIYWLWIGLAIGPKQVEKEQNVIARRHAHKMSLAIKSPEIRRVI